MGVGPTEVFIVSGVLLCVVLGGQALAFLKAASRPLSITILAALLAASLCLTLLEQGKVVLRTSRA